MHTKRKLLVITFIISSMFSEIAYSKGAGKGGMGGGGRGNNKNKGMQTDKEIALGKLNAESKWTPLQSYIIGFYPNYGTTTKFDAISDLIDQGADINQQGKYGNTALLESLKIATAQDILLYEQGNSELYHIINYLIDHEANPNIENFLGETAFYIALVRAPWHIVLRLVQGGANLYYSNSNNQTALDYIKDHKYFMISDPEIGGMGWCLQEFENRIAYLQYKGVTSAKPLSYVISDYLDATLDCLALGHRLGDPTVTSSPHGNATIKLIKYIGKSEAAKKESV